MFEYARLWEDGAETAVIDGEVLCREYDDWSDGPDQSPEKEHAFRQGFLEEARRVAREWTDPVDDCFDPWGELEAAYQLRRRVRRRYSVYGAGRAGRKTYHLGFRSGHALAAARLRGRHHALVYVTQSWDHVKDFDAFDRVVLPAWLTAIERWAKRPLRWDGPEGPPMPLEIKIAKALPKAVQPKTPQPPSRKRIRLVRADDITMRPPDWLLRGTLERDTLALVFGDPGCGKSFVAIDWACRVATGTPWRGRPVRGGAVIYVAGEGQLGFGRRIRAWSEHTRIALDGVPLFMAPAVAIATPAELLELCAAIDEAAGPPALIVLDTLARCFGGGDENSTQDMSQFVTACDALRRRYGCTVLIVHHSGHGDKNRARGAIALKAALDAEYRLSNESGLLLTATKMKDAETPPPLGLELVTVELPDLLDEDGAPITSAVVHVLDVDVSAIIPQAKKTKRGKWQQLGLEVAHRLANQSDDGQVAVDAWREACKQGGMVRQNQLRVLEAFERQEEIVVADEVMTLTSL